MKTDVYVSYCPQTCSAGDAYTVWETYVIQENQRLSPPSSHITDAVKKAIVVKCRNHLLNEEYQQPSGDNGQCQIVQLEQNS